MRVPAPVRPKESLNGKNWKLTPWIRTTCWRRLAKSANEFLDKGQQVFVETELRGDAVDGSQNPRIRQRKDQAGNLGQLRAHGPHRQVPWPLRGQWRCKDW
jgi:single-stranded DNA-binding protein